MTFSQKVVTPAKAGVQKYLRVLDSGFHRNDENGTWRLFTNVTPYPSLKNFWY
jgi:hypothetical protein